MKYYDNKHHTMKRETIEQAALEHAVNTTDLLPDGKEDKP